MDKLHGVKTARAGWFVAIPAGVAVVAMLLSKLTKDAGMWWDVAWTAAAIGALAGTLLARRVASGPNRSRWTFWAGACGAWLFGQLAWDLFGITGSPASPNPADIGWWAFAILVMLSIVRTRGQSRSLRLVAVVEVLPVILGAAALVYAELWHDAGAGS